MDLSKIINAGETVERTEKQTRRACLKNSLMANLFYIILWIGFDIFFIYVISMKGVTEKFWFVTISVAGLNLVRLWVYVFNCFKLFAEADATTYIFTDKAVYYYYNGKFKDLKRIGYEEIITLEKSEYYYDGFYVASADKMIKVVNTNEVELFAFMGKKIKEAA